MDNQNQFIPPQELVPQPVLTPPQPPMITEKPRMKLWKKVLLSFAVVIVGLTIVSYAVFINLPRILTILYPNDSALIDNSNLLLQKVSVPVIDNGFYDLDKITKAMVNIPYDADNQSFAAKYTDYANPVKWDQKLVDQVLKDNEQALGLFDVASKKNYIQIPQLSDPATITVDTPLPNLMIWRDLARLQSVKAQSLLVNGKPDQALQEAAKIYKVGHSIINGHGPIISMLVGLAIKNTALNTLSQIISQGNLRKSTIQDVSITLSNNSDDLEGYKDAYRSEYMNSTRGLENAVPDLIASIKQDNIDVENITKFTNRTKYGYYFKVNQTKNLYTNLFNMEFSAVGVSCYSNDPGALIESQNAEFDNLSQSEFKSMFAENFIGRLLFRISGAPLGSVVTKQCQSDLFSGVVQIELAIKQYKLDHKILPASLNDLVPSYLSKVPLDPFDHKPIRYSAQKKILYSVGLAQKDLGGSAGNDWTVMENPTFKIEF